MMRVLFLSNLYPPLGSGGYEQWCQEVADGLHDRGHTVRVLTSRSRRERLQQPDPAWVERELHLEMEFASLVHALRFFTSRTRREQENLATLRRVVGEFEPDVILVWGMWNLPRSLPELAEALLPGRVVYYMGDYWPTLPSQHEFYWQAPAQSRLTRLPKALLRPFARALLRREGRPALQLGHVLFPSAYMRAELARQGVQMGQTAIVPGAVDTRPFAAVSEPVHRAQNGRPLSLLYAGRLSPEKGIQTAVEAMHELVGQRGLDDVRLSIVGGGERGFESHLHQAVLEAGLEQHVTFQGPAPKEAMPGLYRQNDVFLFTSTWQEPFGRVLVEAMAAGVAVVGTATGGAGEILLDGENALTFPPGDAHALAERIVRLLEDPPLRRKLVENGRRTALEKFDIRRMVLEIENYLLALVAQPGEAQRLPDQLEPVQAAIHLAREDH